MNGGIEFETSCGHCGAAILVPRQNADIQQILCKKEEELNKTRATLECIREERDQLRRKVHIFLCELDDLKNTKGLNDQLGREVHKTGSNIVSVSRKAERIKLKKTSPSKNDGIQNSERRLHGKDLEPSRLSTGVTEQLVKDIDASSKFHEIVNSASPNWDVPQDFELELERANSRCDNLKSENNLLSLTLQESKSKMEQLHMLLTKFESNNSAYMTSLLYSELISDAYNAILSILEKEISKPEFFKGVSHIKPMHRKQIQIALDALNRLLKESPIASSVSLNDISEGTKDSTLLHSDVISLMDLCRQAEERKRAVKQSIVNLDSFSIEGLQAPSYGSGCKRSVTEIDLENAVLLHELTSVKEELVNLKCACRKSNDRQREFASNHHPVDHQVFNKVSPAASHDCAFGGSVLSSEGDIEYERNKKPAFLSLADLRIGTMTESEIGTELSEALKREQRLKKENERLAFTLQQVQQNSEKRHNTSLEVMSKLKTAYSTLLENGKSDKCKMKFHIQELEQLISAQEEHYKIKLKELKRKVLTYERERENSILPDNETAL